MYCVDPFEPAAAVNTNAHTLRTPKRGCTAHAGASIAMDGGVTDGAVYDNTS
jgi:hypothetical protein